MDTGNDEDILNTEAITDRIDELRELTDISAEELLPGTFDEHEENMEELRRLEEFLEQSKGYGGDHQWEGDWYPGYFVRDSYWQDYAENTAEDCGLLDSEATWPNNCIDWERAASELRQDYNSVEYGGVTYWYR